MCRYSYPTNNACYIFRGTVLLRLILICFSAKKITFEDTPDHWYQCHDFLPGFVITGSFALIYDRYTIDGDQGLQNGLASVRMSVPSIDSSSGVRRVCC